MRESTAIQDRTKNSVISTPAAAAQADAIQ
jgi:hypothetical protein